MKSKLVLAVFCCFFAVNVLAQERKTGKLGFEYGLERVDPRLDEVRNPYRYDNEDKFIYIESFNCHRASILYQQPIYKGIYIEPRLSYYYMEYNTDFAIMGSGATQNREYGIVLISDLKEQGLGASLHIGYNLKLYNKWSVDLFVAPDYRYALESKRPRGYDFLEVDEDFGVAVYDPGYLILKGGIGVNYGALSLNFSYGKYISDRFNINKDAFRPEVLTIALAFKFGL